MRITGNGILGFVVGIAGLAYGYFQYKKSKEIADKLETTVEDLAQKQPMDISEAAMKAALDRAVEREVRTQTANTITEVKRELRSEVRKKVQDAWDDITEEVGVRITEEADRIDMAEFRRRVEKKAEEAVINKFYELGGIPRIYGALAKAADGTKKMSGETLKGILETLSPWDRADVATEFAKRM